MHYNPVSGFKSEPPPGLGLSQQQQSYAYSYDKLNRLNLANYTTAGSAGKYNEALSYDKMGNILTLKRTNSLSGYLNDFSYTYENNGQSNKLPVLQMQEQRHKAAAIPMTKTEI